MKKKRDWITKVERKRMELLRSDLVRQSERVDGKKKIELETNIRTITRELQFDEENNNKKGSKRD